MFAQLHVVDRREHHAIPVLPLCTAQVRAAIQAACSIYTPSQPVRDPVRASDRRITVTEH